MPSARRRPGLSQAELQARLGLPRTTLYRLLGTLVGRGLLRRDPLRRVYCLGQRCFEYARTSYAMPDLVAAAGAELRALRDISGETSYLAALDGLEVVSLDRCDGAHSQRSHTEPGQRKPLHCTSQGKAILSALPAEAARRAGEGHRAQSRRRRAPSPTGAACRPSSSSPRRAAGRSTTRRSIARRALLRRADHRPAGPRARRDQHRRPVVPPVDGAAQPARPRGRRGGAAHRRATRRRVGAAARRRGARDSPATGRSKARMRSGMARPACCCGPTCWRRQCTWRTCRPIGCWRGSTSRSKRCCRTATAPRCCAPTAGTGSTSMASMHPLPDPAAPPLQRAGTPAATACCGPAWPMATAGVWPSWRTTAPSSAAGTSPSRRARWPTTRARRRW